MTPEIREYFSHSVLPQCREFDVFTGFRNTCDMHFLHTHPILGEESRLYQLLYLRVLIENVLTLNTLLRTDERISSLMFIDSRSDGASLLFADYRCRGYHYHLYIPTVFLLDPERDRIVYTEPLQRDPKCPVCYDELQTSIVLCHTCGAAVCYQCCPIRNRNSNNTISTVCCMCRSSPSLENLHLQILEPFLNRDRFEEELVLYFWVKDGDDSDYENDCLLKIEIASLDDYREFVFLRQDESKFYDTLVLLYRGHESSISTMEPQEHPCLPSVPVLTIELKEVRKTMEMLRREGFRFGF